jgi:hypothetical protein
MVLPIETADRHSRDASLDPRFRPARRHSPLPAAALHHEAFGVSLAEAELLLAATGWLRIAGYGWVARYYAVHGPRAACLLAAAGSVLATLGYALSSGLLALIVARLLWGSVVRGDEYRDPGIGDGGAERSRQAERAYARGDRRRSRQRADRRGSDFAIWQAAARLSLVGLVALVAFLFALRLPNVFGARRALTVLSIASAIGLAVIGFGWLWSGAVLVVVLRGLIQPLPPPIVAFEHPGADRIPALARKGTWRDLGAGAGPLLAGALLPMVPHELLYGGAPLLLAISAVAIGRRTP